MKQTFKRIISVVLITVILASLIPVGAATDPAVDAKVKEIAAACRAEGLTDEWEIALWLHDWLIYNANYDYTYT
ncbi:MAG: hypothetical protein IKZ19_03025, partial [Clostridia bacterium]|nr:hypothetical protein [Clostridia bacterium]